MFVDKSVFSTFISTVLILSRSMSKSRKTDHPWGLNHHAILMTLSSIFSLLSASITSASVFINELYPNPQSGESEWIELFNLSDTEAILTGMTLTDLTSSVFHLDGFTILPHGFLTLFKGTDFSFALNNVDETVTLKSSTGSTLDTISYSTSTLGKSIGRPSNLLSTVTTLEPTQNSANPSVDLTHQELQITEVAMKEDAHDWVELYVSDDLNHGSGSMLKQLELRLELRSDTLLADLTGISVQTGDYIAITLAEDAPSIIKENNIIHVHSTASNLTGTVEQVYLYHPPSDAVHDAICWVSGDISDSEKTDHAYLFAKAAWNNPDPTSCTDSSKVMTRGSIGRKPDSTDTNSATEWAYFTRTTIGNFNISKNTPPDAIISIQSGGTRSSAPLSINVTGEFSSDPEGDSLSFAWVFGNGVTSTSKNPASQTFSTPGTYPITLTVTDALGLSTKRTLEVTVLPQGLSGNSSALSLLLTQEKEQAKTSTTTTKSSSSTKSSPTPAGQTTIQASTTCSPTPSALYISEIFPNPKGKDEEQEFIELYNTSEQDISLCGVRITNKDGAKSQYVFHATDHIPPLSALVLPYSLTHLTLHNALDTISLFGSNQELIDQVTYEKAPEGKSLQRRIFSPLSDPEESE